VTYDVWHITLGVSMRILILERGRSATSQSTLSYSRWLCRKGMCQMAGTPQDTPQETHKDLLALIKASRDLDPDMDQALAESFLEKHTLATQGAQQPVVPQSDPP